MLFGLGGDIEVVYYITSVESDEFHTSGDIFARGGAECERHFLTSNAQYFSYDHKCQNSRSLVP